MTTLVLVAFAVLVTAAATATIMFTVTARWAGRRETERLVAAADCPVYHDGRHRCECSEPWKTGRPASPHAVWPPLDTP